MKQNTGFSEFVSPAWSYTFHVHLFPSDAMISFFFADELYSIVSVYYTFIICSFE